jgi:hypothetical protein
VALNLIMIMIFCEKFRFVTFWGLNGPGSVSVRAAECYLHVA